MDYGDYYWGVYRDYCKDPFPHSLLSTRQNSGDFDKRFILVAKVSSEDGKRSVQGVGFGVG